MSGAARAKRENTDELILDFDLQQQVRFDLPQRFAFARASFAHFARSIGESPRPYLEILEFDDQWDHQMIQALDDKSIFQKRQARLALRNKIMFFFIAAAMLRGGRRLGDAADVIAAYF